MLNTTLSAIVLAAPLGFAVPSIASAEVYNYVCAGKRLKVDDTKMTLTYNNDTFKIVQDLDCAKYGWHVQKDGKTVFDFCTATQGYGGIHVDGVDHDLVDCNLQR